MPDPSTHIQSRPTTTRRADAAWDDWSTAWTRHIPVLTGRDDLSVFVAPGAAGTAPACYLPDLARIEIDATHIGDPQITNPRRAGHKQQVPTAYGLLVHEAAHATHSRWNTPADTPPIVAAAADLLEESRIENRQRQRRRGDRRWLRHVVTTLIHPDDTPIDDPWHAGKLAGLLLARVDARIITTKDTRTARQAITDILDRSTLADLRTVWRQAHTTDDTDTTTMIELGWRWCRILGIDPNHHPQILAPDPGIFAGTLAAAITDYLAAAAGLTPTEYLTRHTGGGHTTPATWTEREPTADERAAARHLGTRLRHARTEHNEPGSRPSVTPPGRLRTRHAITGQAQIATGNIPTATPWQRRTTQPPHKPVLRLAVLVDVSGSMTNYTAPMSSAAWILAHAPNRSEAITTTIAFGATVTALIPPGHRPDHVLQMRAQGGTDTFTGAVKLADQILDLRHPGTIRMLAIVSDGDLPNPQPAQHLLTTLHHAGCAILWLRPADLPGHTFDHTTTLALTDPIHAIRHIADAATTALATA